MKGVARTITLSIVCVLLSFMPLVLMLGCSSQPPDPDITRCQNSNSGLTGMNELTLSDIIRNRVFHYLPPSRQSGISGVPSIQWESTGINSIGTAGPVVSASVNSAGGQSPVFLGNGAAYQSDMDFFLPLNGIDWFHERVFSSKTNYSGTEWAGEGWWVNEMMNLTVAGSEGASNVSVQVDPHWTYAFTYSAGAWTCDDKFLLTLTFDGGNDEYLVRRADGFLWVFHDSQATNAGKLKRIEDPYGNDWAFTYSSGKLTDIVVDVVVGVVAGTDHKITYTYFTSGDNNGLLQYIKVYKSTTTTDANLIGQVEHVYHDSTSDSYGLEDDLMKVIVTRKATTDGDGTLSIEETTSYRYYKGTYDASTNPGTDHQLRYVLLPENRQRLTDEVGTPESQTNTSWESYANVFYKYDTSARATFTDERLPGGSCGCGAGGNAATTNYTWSVNGSSTDVDTWKVHMVADREDDTRVIADFTRVFQVLTWVVQDQDDGTPTIEDIWHFDYGTSGDTENRLTAAHLPSACSDYDESSPYSVTLRSNAGVVYTVEYDTGTYARYPKKLRVKQGTGGTPDTLTQYARTVSERPDLVTTVTTYESASEADGRATTLAYTFYDGSKLQPSEIDITHPSVSTGKNGPNSSAVDKMFFDKRTGATRWTLDGEGFVNFFAYDDETGVENFSVVDANTSSLLAGIDNTWDGVAHGGLAADDTVPFSRTGGGTALDLDSSRTLDWLGRVRKTVDAGGMITYVVYKDDETRVYPAWNTSTCLLPIHVTTTDKEGRPENVLTLLTSVTPTKDANNEPTGAESYGNTDLATRTINAYNISGMLSDSDRYHDIPSTGTGTRYTNYYRITLEYDGMGRLEYRIEDVNDESTYDREQVKQNVYDFLGRLITSKEAVSDNSHNIGSGKPTMITTAEYFHDDPDSDSTPERGAGDGNLHWVRRWFGSGGSDYNDTEMRYDWRNRRCLTINPLAPHTLVKFDNLDRVTASGTYTATTNLDPGDDPASTENGNRADLSKTYFDEWGRVYKTESYDDPGDVTPADTLISNTYYDRRGLVWASDPPNSGISYTEYDGAGRRTKTYMGTQFDSAKFTSSAPDYPDANEGIVELTEYTLDDVGQVQKVIHKELNHTDTNGMDPAGSDFIRTYVYHWFDAAHRLTDTANYGTNNSDGWKDNSTAPSYGASAPSRSDTVLVTTYAYDTAGRQNSVTDPKAYITASVFDDLGRVTRKDEDDGGADERITLYAYNGLGSLATITADVSTDQVTAYMYEGAQNAHWVSKIKYPATDTANGKTLGQPSDETYDRITFTYNKDGTLNTRTDQNGTVLTWSYDALRRKTEEEVTTVGSATGYNVDSAVRAITWTYTSDGLTEFVTTHSDTTPDTSTWTDAVNQVKYTYDGANRLTKEEQEPDGAVDGSTLSVQYTYGTDYSTGNYARLNKLTYPDGKVLWNGYTHTDTSNTFEDTINDTFSRVGQLAFDNSGAIGNIIAEYSFNGLSREILRNHDDANGWYGNDTKVDLYHGTSGAYTGLDRFGRVVDMKFVNYSGSATNFDRATYTYDRDSNRTSLDRPVTPSRGQAFTYDRLNRLTEAKTGIFNSTKTLGTAPSAREGWTLDDLGNISGLAYYGTSNVIQHTTNETNEISSLATANPSGQPKVVFDNFNADTLDDTWSTTKGTFTVTDVTDPDKLEATAVDGTTSTAVEVMADNTFEDGSFVLKVKFPSGTTSGRAGFVFGHDGTDTYHAVVLRKNGGTDTLEVAKYTSGAGWGSALDSSTGTVTANTEYTIRGWIRQKAVYAKLDGQNVDFTYNSTTFFGAGKVGCVTTVANTTFDDFTYLRATPHDPACPGWNTTANVTLNTGAGTLTVTGNTYGGSAVSQWAGDDDYVAEADIDLNSGALAQVQIRYTDPDNWMAAEIRANGSVKLVKCLDGRETNVASNTYTTAATVNVRIKASGTTYTIWVDGTQKINTTDGDIAWGTLALTGRSPKFSNVKAGYDNNADGDIADAGDDLVLSETFAGTAFTLNADHSDGTNDAWCRAGNLIDDGQMRYTYDAWNRLVKVTRKQDTDIVIQTAEYDGLGRRVQKVVTESGDLDGTFVYYYADTQPGGSISGASPGGWSIVEVRDGSNNVYQQVYHGTQYIDEIVAMRLEKGYAVVYQDANWNTIATCDLAGRVLERVFTTPYGSPIIEPETYFGDYDGDGDVDSSDDASLGSGQTCWGSNPTAACRVFDFNQDGTLNASDETTMTALVSAASTNRRHENRTVSPTGMEYTHQGLADDPAIKNYFNRNRVLSPAMQRFLSRDILIRRGMSEANWAYLYVSANPLILSDPLGLQARECDAVPDCDACGRFCDAIRRSTPGVRAFAYCCGGTGRVCICEGYGDTTNCLRAHEEQHLQQSTCDKCCGMYGGSPRPGYEDREARECEATMIQLDCLARHRCRDRNSGCYDDWDEHRDDACDYARSNCGDDFEHEICP